MTPFTFPRKDPNPEKPRNHEFVWSEYDLKILERHASAGKPLDSLCADFGRTRISILSKLKTLGIIRETEYNSGVYHYCVGYPATDLSPTKPTTKPTTKDNTIMALIETKTFICGDNAATLSDMDIFKKIAATEVTIESLEAIKAKPRKLSELITKLKGDVLKLGEYVDNRP